MAGQQQPRQVEKFKTKIKAESCGVLTKKSIFNGKTVFFEINSLTDVTTQTVAKNFAQPFEKKKEESKGKREIVGGGGGNGSQWRNVYIDQWLGKRAGKESG